MLNIIQGVHAGSLESVNRQSVQVWFQPSVVSAFLYIARISQIVSSRTARLPHILAMLKHTLRLYLIDLSLPLQD